MFAKHRPLLKLLHNFNGNFTRQWATHLLQYLHSHQLFVRNRRQWSVWLFPMHDFFIFPSLSIVFAYSILYQFSQKAKSFQRWMYYSLSLPAFHFRFFILLVTVLYVWSNNTIAPVRLHLGIAQFLREMYSKVISWHQRPLSKLINDKKLSTLHSSAHNCTDIIKFILLIIIKLFFTIVNLRLLTKCLRLNSFFSPPILN
jgi:hypothetical protein